MATAGDIKVTISLCPKISLWEAIKLRIAGRNFQPIVLEILRKIAAMEK